MGEAPKSGWHTDRGRKRRYFVLMGLCLTMVVLAWTVIWRFSTIAAVVLSGLALLIPRVAAMVANAGDEQRPRG